MKPSSIIFDSELDFRNFLIENSKDIKNIIIYEDNLDKYIYFYSFTINNLLLATKEPITNDFYYYSEIYENLIEKLKISINSNKTKVLKLIRQ